MSLAELTQQLLHVFSAKEMISCFFRILLVTLVTAQTFNKTRYLLIIPVFVCVVYTTRILFRRGDNWRNLDFKEGGKGVEGGMMVTDVTMFHKHHLGGRGVLEYVCVLGFQDFECWEGGRPNFGVDVEGVYRT